MICKKRGLLYSFLFYAAIVRAASFDAKRLFEDALMQLNDGNVEKSKDLFELIYKKTGSISALYNAAFVKKIMACTNTVLLDEAIKDLEWLVEVYPEYNEAQMGLGFAYLERGDYQKGWAQHAHYLKRSGKYAPELRDLVLHDQLVQKTILLRYEGGLGDSIHFIRYANVLKKRGATVFVYVQTPLKKLFSLCPYIDGVLTSSDRVPLFDASATLMSMPAVWWGQYDAMPADVPYLYVDKELVKKWSFIRTEEKKLNIGICWQSDVYNDSSRLAIARRGIPLSCLLSLAQQDIPLHLYSLQKKDGADEAKTIPSDLLTVFGDDFDESAGSFMDTAALMMSLDLIITIDSAVAHLAGALGRPVWLLLPYSSDWRWIKGKQTSPWYPTMKIFQQSSPFDWETVIQEIKKELQVFK